MKGRKRQKIFLRKYKNVPYGLNPVLCSETDLKLSLSFYLAEMLAKLFVVMESWKSTKNAIVEQSTIA